MSERGVEGFAGFVQDAIVRRYRLNVTSRAMQASVQAAQDQKTITRRKLDELIFAFEKLLPEDQRKACLGELRRIHREGIGSDSERRWLEDIYSRFRVLDLYWKIR